jgi:hypothetical protein
MTDYILGHVKRDPVTGSVAVRTIYPESDVILAQRAWMIATPHEGSRHVATEEVADWDDLYAPLDPANLPPGSPP